VIIIIIIRRRRRRRRRKRGVSAGRCASPVRFISVTAELGGSWLMLGTPSWADLKSHITIIKIN
jgi:hypothetical protein